MSDDDKKAAQDAAGGEGDDVAADEGDDVAADEGDDVAADEGDGATGGDEGAAATDAADDSQSATVGDAAAAGKVKSAADDERMDLPKWNRARVKRKQPKGEETDAFQQGVRKAGRNAIQRAPVVIGLIVLVAGIISGVVWYQDKREEDRAMATRMLAQAVGFQARAQVVDVAQYTKDRKHPFPIPLVNDEDERDQKVSSSLEELESTAPDGPVAVAARLVEAARLVRAGKFADAESAYQGFLDAHASHELAFLAREGLAFAQEAQGNADGALAQFEALMGSEGDFYRDQAMWHKARILEGQGKSDEALTLYRQYAQEFPLEEASVARQQVIGRLQELAPELVPAPPEQAGGLNLPGGIPGLGQ